MLPSSLSMISMEAQARIDDEIAELKQTICKLQAQINALSTQRNSLSPISRIPPEILSAIFVQYAKTHLESMIEPESTQVPDWVSVSYVCRHWRNVAMGCPTLWTHIFLASRSWTDELLSRSKAAPLKVRSTWFPSGSPEYGGEVRRIKHLKHVLTHIQRIQDLEISVPSQGHEEILSVFASPAPLLQSLILNMGDGHRIPSFFNGVVPALCQLKLFSCSLPLPTPTLRSLTTLILYRSRQLTLDELKTVLYSSQSLMHLELLDTLGQISSKRDSHPSEVFRPPHLLRLAIAEESFNVIQLLSWLDIPSQTEVRIGITLLQPETWATLRSLIAQRLFTSEDNPLARSSIRTLAINIHSMRVTFTMFRTNATSSTDSQVSSPLDRDWDCDIPLRLSLFGSLERDIVRDILQDALHRDFFADLESSLLTVDGNGGNCSTLLEDIISLVPQLWYIKMINGGTTNLRTLFSLLSHTPSDTPPHPTEDPAQTTLPNQPSHSILAPFLRELVFSDCLFDHLFADDRRNGRTWDLYKALASREMKGYFLNRLTFTKCLNVVEDSVIKLKKVAEEVVWDGVEDDVSEYSTSESEAVDDEDDEDDEESS